MTGPYAEAAWIYWHAGWRGVLPLPAGAKWPPPRGYTGWTGVDPSGADVAAWVDGDQGAGNIALRLGDGLYGLDVDDYGGKSGGAALTEMTVRLGPLPATWIASSRDDSLSGIRLFRAELPAGRRWRDEPAGRGAGIEAIHRGHRYVVVWPSIHPEGRKYRWRRPTGELAAEGEVPRLADLPELPPAWVADLSEPGEARTGDMAGHHETVEIVNGWREGEPCPRVAAALKRAFVEMAACRDGAALHPTGLAHVHELVRLGHEGHVGVKRALAEHYSEFVAIRSGRDGDRVGAEREWWRMTRGAVGKLSGQRREVCDCSLWAGDGLYLEGPPTWAPLAIEAKPSTRTEEPPSEPPDAVSAMTAALLTSSQLAQLPPPRPLVAGLLYLNRLSWLIGKPASGKSFLALDLAQHVGHGWPWAGRRVHQGRVLYLAAEGAAGMSLRVRAWRKAKGPLSDDVYFLPYPVQAANSEAWATLVEVAARLRPALIVIDTQARISVGLKENDNTEMGRLIEQIDRLRRACEACVLVIHHIGRSGEDARGASAIDGAQDTELRIERVGEARMPMTARLSVEKQKDGPDDITIDLVLEPIELGEVDENGDPLTSLVVRHDAFLAPAVAPWRDGLPERQRMIIEILDEMFGDRGGTRAEVMRVLAERGGIGGKFKASAFYAAWKRLDQAGRIKQVEGTQRFVVIPPDPVSPAGGGSNPFTITSGRDIDE